MTIEVREAAPETTASCRLETPSADPIHRTDVRRPAEAERRTARSLAWIADAVLFAYVLSGGMLFDARLALGPLCSLNQVLGLATLVNVAIRIRNGDRVCGRDAQTLLVVSVLTVLLAARSIGTANPAYAFFKIVSYVAMVIPVIVHLEFTVRTRADVERLLRVGAVAMFALVVLSLPHMLSMEGGQRLAVLGGGPNTLARHIGTGLIATITLLCMRRHRNGRFLAVIIGLVVCGAALLLTGTKAVMMSLLVSATLLLAHLGRKRALVVVASGLLVLTLAPLVGHDFVRDLPKDGGLVRLLRLPDFDDPLGSYGSRLGFVGDTWNELRSNPWLGAGTGAWGMHLGFDEAYPHNMVLEILGELGVVGLVLVLAVVTRWIRRDRATAVRGPGDRTSYLEMGLLGMVLFWGINVQLSGDLVNSRYFWLWLAVWELYRRRMRGRGEPDAATAA